jgi:hypothetical protein
MITAMNTTAVHVSVNELYAPIENVYTSVIVAMVTTTVVITAMNLAVLAIRRNFVATMEGASATAERAMEQPTVVTTAMNNTAVSKIMVYYNVFA